LSVTCRVNNILAGGVYQNHEGQNEGNRLSGFIFNNSHRQALQMYKCANYIVTSCHMCCTCRSNS